MKNNKKTYWKGIEELRNDPDVVKNAEREFPESITESGNGSSRRDFLKMMGFSIAAASLAACEAPIRNAIPYVNKPEDIDPGIPNYYASTYFNGGDVVSVVVKTREGRPIKVEGNEMSTITNGGITGQVEASVLSLYDNSRLRGPKIDQKSSSWEEVDKLVGQKLKSVNGKGKTIAIVSNTVASPSTNAAIAALKETYSTVEHIAYDQQSASGLLQANKESFGTASIPSYDFSKADVIVSFSADFLGGWVSPAEHSGQYSKTRDLTTKKTMSRHYQFEANMSLTGANADYRVAVKPSQEGLAVAKLYNLIASKAGGSKVSTGDVEINHLQKAADELWKAKGKSLVVSGSNDKAVQVLVNGINDMLSNYGATIDLSTPSYTRKGDDASMKQFVSNLSKGSVGAVVFFNANPVYDHPMGAAIASGLAKAELSVATNMVEDETASVCQVLAPDNHYLEAWNDAEIRKGSFSVAQPTIAPLFQTRQAPSSFLAWAGKDSDYFSFLKNNWNQWFSAENTLGSFQVFWDTVLHNGVYETKSTASAVAVDSTTVDSIAAPSASFAGNTSAAGASIAKNYKADNSGVELAIYQNVGIGNGSQANNPLLQELPDPITKATWDNYLTVAIADAQGLKMFEGETKLAELTVNGTTIEVPVLIQPGQAKGTVGLAIGYGRTNAGKVANGVGVNAYPFITEVNGTQSFNVTSGVAYKITDKPFKIAQTQTHETHMERDNVLRETTLADFVNDPAAGNERPEIATWLDEEDHKVAPGALSLWHGHDYNNHHWGLAIDLNTCNGCSACIVSCNVENNIPMVGKEEVLNRREMHWLRIDRYYSSDADVDDRVGLEQAAENPDVTFQPMMCQHCNNAPCETVCPVAATMHSTEGLNQMAYNRCIGTRYCANNCPYKVRRFNWFKYHDNEQFSDANPQMNTDLGKMVLNPDVTVRSRGVMEKCSFCVQRIQAGKLQAKLDRRKVKDGEVNVACASSCPTGGLIFGDMNDPESKVSQLLKVKVREGSKSSDKVTDNPRSFHVLEEVGVKPNVTYLTKVRNVDQKTEA